MSESAFPLNDLTRRRLQTLLAITVICLSVASTMFIVSLGNQIGFRTLSLASKRLTTSFAGIFSNFILFTLGLIFASDITAVSFMTFVMMTQRTRDMGLMKAAGCPNNTIFGSYMTELTIISLTGCLIGTIIGFAVNYVSSAFLRNLGSASGLSVWAWAGIFIIYFLFSLAAGAKPILNATKMSPVMAMSPQFRLGVTFESDFRGASKMGLTFKIAFRGIFRRKRANLHVILCLLMMFTLITMALTGAIIANQTTTTWIQNASNTNVILISHRNVSEEYRLLCSKFYEVHQEATTNYTDLQYLIPQKLISELRSLTGITVDPRLFMETIVKEIKGYSIDPETLLTTWVGDDRQSTSLLVGVEPENVTGNWLIDGKFLEKEDGFSSVLGDSLANEAFSVPKNESIDILGQKFQIKGVCIEPLNNGRVAYIPLRILEGLTNVNGPNILLVKITSSENRVQMINQITDMVSDTSIELSVYDMNEQTSKQVGFLSDVWNSVLYLPALGLLGASACLVSYVILTVSEQQSEFGVLRAVGAKPKAVRSIVAIQNALVLLAGSSTSIALGIMTTLLILVPNPIVTTYDILQISAWLLLALAIIFGLSLLPAIKLAKKPIGDLLAQN